MRLGLQIPRFTWPGGPAQIGATLRRVAREADQAGIASLWVMDHFFQIEYMGPPELEMLEGYCTLAHLAAITESITLGTLVTGVTYRHPGILIKTVTTLDVLSGGRAWLGIGAAWNEEEHRGLGVPYPSTAERFERLEETLQIADQMFRGDKTPYAGTHYQLERPLNSPLPLSQPRPKIMVGGGGEQKTLRFVATYADACNLFEGPELAHKLAVLEQRCAEVGRDYADIERTTLSGIALGADGLSVDQAVERFGRLAEVGIDHAIVSLRDVHAVSFDLVAEVVEQLAKITPSGR